MDSNRGCVLFLSKYFEKAAWNAGMASSGLGISPAAAGAWTGTRRRGGCVGNTAGGVETSGWWVFFSPTITRAQETLVGRVLLGKDSAHGKKINDCSREKSKASVHPGKSRSREVLLPNSVPPLKGNVLRSSSMENSRNGTNKRQNLRKPFFAQTS